MNTLSGGLVSITFRKLAPRKIVELVGRSGLQSIEWGGDVHVPHGDTSTAADVAVMTRDAGLTPCAYGSYYRLGESEAEGLAFSAVVDSAATLGAPLIRVWPGKRGSADADAAYRDQVVRDALRCGDLAQRAGLRIVYEFHGGTLTDTKASALDLLAATEHPAIDTVWQPPNGMVPDEALDGLRAVLPRVAHLHAFAWDETPEGRVRQALQAHTERWKQYLAVAAGTGRALHVLLEFVRGDTPEQFLADAATLRACLDEGNERPQIDDRPHRRGKQPSRA